MPPPAEVVILTPESIARLPVPDSGRRHDPLPRRLPGSATPASRQIQVHKSVQKNGVIRYSDMMPEQGHELLLFNDCYACDPASKVNGHHRPLPL